jgi:hypothetical protein
MKKPILIYCALLGLATSLSAQSPTSPATGEPQSKPAKASAYRVYPTPTRLPPEVTNKERFHDVTLEPGTLREVVYQLDEVYSQVQRSDGPVEYNMPNLIWTPETMDLPVPAPLRLFEVNAVDSLALIAAAAGCKLEPIESPQAEAKETRIIGYKFVRMEAGGGMMGGSAYGAAMGGMAPGVPAMGGHTTGGGMGTVRVVTPGDPNSPATVTFQSRTGPGPGMPGSSAISTVTSTSSSSSPGNVRDLQDQLVRFETTLGEDHPQIVNLKRQLEIAQKVNVQRQITRVYAMRGILQGDNREVTEKLEGIKQSIYVATGGDGIKEKDIQISYHEGTNILVVRAPEAALDLIEQVIEALRENVKGGKP